MTAAEIEYWKDFKISAADELADITNQHRESYIYALDDTDPRIGEYVQHVADNPEAHNLYEILAVRRFFHLLDRYEWKPGRICHFFDFYEILRFSGTYGRQSYKLTPVQCFQFANIYGFARPDGTRLTTSAYIFVPRKFSKTTSSAAMAVYDLLFGDFNAQAYVGANSYQQAHICFEEIRNIMFDLDPMGRHLKINREKISFNSRGRESTAECLTANAKTKDGLNASLVIMDEYSQARNTKGKNGADLKNVLTSSMGVRKEPLTVVITTASDVIDGPFTHELDGVKAILRGEIENDTVFASLFMPDVEDREDDPRTWAKVQPHLGITVQPSFYANEYASAQLSAENMMNFRTKMLNVFAINEQKMWISEEKAREVCCGDFNTEDIQGRPQAAVAFDLSVRDDFSAVTYTWYNKKEKNFISFTDYYFPEGALADHPNGKLYEVWYEQGHLNLCKGDKIDVKQIAADIMRRQKYLDIIRIGYDAYKSQELVAILSSVGASIVLQSYSQTYGAFNIPVESMEMLIYDDPPKLIVHNNPINIFCMTNCVLDEDRLENKKPLKASQYRKIDGTITLLMTLGQLYSYKR